ncbi:hypothetical protein CRD_00148 [Raphidiopsis brookii D9]|nr:hypothetical protein CRD_00148 [Raphidiopsis brookii D9]
MLNAYSLGVSRRTVVSLALQIANERVNKDRLVRRRTAQVQIAFDIYLRALYQNRPDISFFFTNHVASSLHRYWPSLFPNDFKSLKYDQFWVERWSDEILFAMREAAYQIGQLMAFVERYPGSSRWSQ